MGFNIISINSLGNKKEVITGDYSVATDTWYDATQRASTQVYADFTNCTTFDYMFDLTAVPPASGEQRYIVFGEDGSDNYMKITWKSKRYYDVYAVSQGKTRAYSGSVSATGDTKNLRMLLVNMRSFSAFTEHYNPLPQYDYYDLLFTASTAWTSKTNVGTLSSPPATDDMNSFLANVGILHLKPRYPWKDPENASTEGGGEGAWDDNNTDDITTPDMTQLNSESFAKTFLTTTYRLNFEELTNLSNAFWQPTVLQSLKDIFTNPMESVVGLTLIPVDSISPSTVDIIVGSVNLGVTGHLILNQYVDVNCGEIAIPEKWGGALDYSARVSLYLPFIGTHELDTQEVMGSTLGVRYIVDVISGACVAYVTVKREPLNSVLYQFTGSCAYNLPLSRESFSQTMSAILSASLAIGVGVASGGAGTPLLVNAGASVAMSARPHVAHAGNLAGNSGFMGIKKPYVILSRPVQALPEDFGKYKGFQSHITKTLSDCTGFTKVEEIHLEGITATADELSEIERLLKDGVII